MPLGDETYTIILNSKASDQESAPQLLRDLFLYMNEQTVAESNDLLERIDRSVDRWNSPERRRVIMTFDQEVLSKANKAREEGIRIGREEGLAQGRAEGLEQGRTEGHNERNRIIAKDMKSAGEPIEKIIRYTGLTGDEIDDL